MEQNHQKVLKLLDCHGAELYRLIGRITRCEHTASDLMQDLFICLSRSNGFNRSSSTYAYAWKTAANLAFEWRRRQKVQLVPLSQAEMAVDSKCTALEQLISEEQFELVLNCTAELSELARNVVVMRYIEQESYDHIAKCLGKNPAYLRSICSKAISQLRGLLYKYSRNHTDREASHG